VNKTFIFLSNFYCIYVFFSPFWSFLFIFFLKTKEKAGIIYMNKTESIIMRSLVYLYVCFEERSLIIYLEKKKGTVNRISVYLFCVLLVRSFVCLCMFFFSLCVFSTTSKRLDVVLLFFFVCHKACVCACFFFFPSFILCVCENVYV
jgi:hypothetical protein